VACDIQVLSPTYAAPAGPGTGGLNGVHDIIVALHWVQLYIHNFGGNASQVCARRSPPTQHHISTSMPARPVRTAYHLAGSERASTTAWSTIQPACLV
jgi:hypothetical protein